MRYILAGFSLAWALVFVIDLFVRQPDFHTVRSVSEREEFFQIAISFADSIYRRTLGAVEFAVAMAATAATLVALLLRRRPLVVSLGVASATMLVLSHVTVTGRQWLFEFGSIPWPAYISFVISVILLSLAYWLMKSASKKA
jgi:hypothetical protein